MGGRGCVRAKVLGQGDSNTSQVGEARVRKGATGGQEVKA